MSVKSGKRFWRVPELTTTPGDRNWRGIISFYDVTAKIAKTVEYVVARKGPKDAKALD
jgi:hypothetical protein